MHRQWKYQNRANEWFWGAARVSESMIVQKNNLILPYLSSMVFCFLFGAGLVWPLSGGSEDKHYFFNVEFYFCWKKTSAPRSSLPFVILLSFSLCAELLLLLISSIFSSWFHHVIILAPPSSSMPPHHFLEIWYSALHLLHSSRTPTLFPPPHCPSSHF